jgi:hypothetical protein
VIGRRPSPASAAAARATKSAALLQHAHPVDLRPAHRNHRHRPNTPQPNEMVALPKKLARYPVNARKRSLREVAAELEAQGYVTVDGKRYSRCTNRHPWPSRGNCELHAAPGGVLRSGSRSDFAQDREKESVSVSVCRCAASAIHFHGRPPRRAHLDVFSVRPCPIAPWRPPWRFLGGLNGVTGPPELP